MPTAPPSAVLVLGRVIPLPGLVRRLLAARRPAPVAVVCERCGLRVASGCWHRLCPLPQPRPTGRAA
jgi:hypothetical protein